MKLGNFKVKVKSLSRVRLFVTPWTVAYQAPQFMEFSRHEYWSGWPCPSPVDLPDPGIKPGSPTLQADTLPSKPPGKSEMVRQHHQFNGHEFEHAPGDGEEQGSLACCNSWGCKESDTTERSNDNSIL